MGQFNFKGVPLSVWARLITLLAVTANLIASLMGYKLIPFEDEQIADFISGALMAGVSFYTAWKNNSLTIEAQEADALMKAKKSQK